MTACIPAKTRQNVYIRAYVPTRYTVIEEKTSNEKAYNPAKTSNRRGEKLLLEDKFHCFFVVELPKNTSTQDRCHNDL